MPRKKCAFGFSCAAMMIQPGLTAEDCPNRETCGVLTELTPEEEVELIRVREAEAQQRREETERIREVIRVNCLGVVETGVVNDNDIPRL